jgi:carbonic anhydrase/acetyltransferase-like protein (isoleucine patch superfamily)
VPIHPFETEQPIIGERVYLHDTAVVIGRVQIAADASLWPYVVARGDVNSIRIGARTNVQDLTMLHVTHDGPYSPGGFPLLIGEDVTVGHKCLLHACQIGDRCLIGMGAIVMDGAVIEDEVLLGAGSLVSPGKRLISGYLYRGNPVRQVRELRAEEREMLRYSAGHYVRLKDKYLAAAAGD